ncbi:MAG TPA: NADH-quinone oxidoreductase subunit L, partial [Anaeromyxobacteraceae bacterium]|nr:NADH-quinone oxidoreductase subunit L [Anaeromyxobacteraceae bacterium]
VFQHFTEPVFAPGTDRLMEVGHFHAGAHPAWPFMAAFAIAVLGTWAGWALYQGGLTGAPARWAAAWPGFYRFWVDKFRVDELYDVVVVKPLQTAAYVLWRVVDVFVIDGIVNGSAKAAMLLGSVTRLTQNGDVQRYAAVMAIAAAAILWTVLGVGGL